MPTIRIDNEVWSYLQGKAKPFEDSPNDVLHRELGIDKAVRQRRSRLKTAARATGKSREPGPDFSPVKIRGENLSATILRERQ